MNKTNNKNHLKQAHNDALATVQKQAAHGVGVGPGSELITLKIAFDQRASVGELPCNERRRSPAKNHCQRSFCWLTTVQTKFTLLCLCRRIALWRMKATTMAKSHRRELNGKDCGVFVRRYLVFGSLRVIY